MRNKTRKQNSFGISLEVKIHTFSDLDSFTFAQILENQKWAYFQNSNVTQLEKVFLKFLKFSALCIVKNKKKWWDKIFKKHPLANYNHVLELFLFPKIVQ